MAITRSSTWLGAGMEANRSYFHQKWNRMRAALSRRKVYRDTYNELASLTDRDLADLGIPRSNIRRLAMEAAYDL